MELNIDRLMIEASRKCNMACEHCLRGAPQRKTIDNNYIHKMFNLIDHVGSLSIGGGEPTLAMETLEYIRQNISYGPCSVGDFYMVTNGKAINVDKLAQFFYEMYNACDDNDMSRIGFSFDRFHTETFSWAQKEKRDRNFYNLKDKLAYEYGLETYANDDIVCKHSDDSWTYDSLIREGRGKECGCRDNSIKYFVEDICDDLVCYQDTTLYLSCTGYLVAGSNWSYHSIDTRRDIRIAHIDDLHCTDDLIEAIQKHNKTRQKMEAVASPE